MLAAIARRAWPLAVFFQKINIALKAGKARALDGTFLKNLLKDFFGKLLPISPVEAQQGWRRQKSGLFVYFGKSIPGADYLAYITAKHPVVHLLRKGVGNFVAELYGQIGDAARSVEPVALRADGLGRTGINAASAASAIIFERGVIGQREVEDYFGQKKP